MTTKAPLPKQSAGQATGFVLGVVAFVCVTMIGVAGYLKYELDRAEAVLAAPESAAVNQSSEDQNLLDKMRRILGYGGFIGNAQGFATLHDAASLPALKSNLKEAEDLFSQLPAATSAGARRDLRSILDTFIMVDQRIEKSTTDPTTVFTLSDLTPLYAALPVLDARVAAAWDVRRAEAQGQAQFWGMLLTLASWCSLIIAAALTAGIALILRDRNSAPLRALAQSVRNMAQGDMRTSIWGMERRDAVGELARAADMARFQFSQLPDMTVLSDDGPIRMRFEGQAHSLFDAMIRAIARDSEQVHEQAAKLTEQIVRQQDTLSVLTGRVEAVLQNVENRAVQGDQNVRQSLINMVGSAESLKHAQEHAADQLNRIIPFMQERAQGLSEITQITGKQVAHVLQSLILTERSLKHNAQQSDDAIRKLSSTADNLGERLFGAVNLLQASGKVLAETTEKTQSRLDEAIDSLRIPPLPAMEPGASSTGGDHDFTPRIEHVIEGLETARAKMEQLLVEQAEATKIQVDLLTTQSTGLLTQTMTASQTLGASADRLRDEQARLDEAIGRVATHMQALGERLDGKDEATPQDLSPRLNLMSEYLVAIVDEIAGLTARLDGAKENQPAFVEDMLYEVKTGFAVMNAGLERMREQMLNLTVNQNAQVPELVEHLRTEFSGLGRPEGSSIATEMESLRGSLAALLSGELAKLESKLTGLQHEPVAQHPGSLREAQLQIEQQTNILAELVTTLGVLDAHMQEIRTEVAQAQRAV